MAVPVQLTTNVQNETFGGVTYHIEGELVPALHVELSNTGLYFEHHILLWKDPAVQIALHPMKGAFKRMLAGMPFLLTGASGPGRIAFSRDGAGHVFGLHLRPGKSMDVREHQWLAATDNVEYTFTRVQRRGEHAARRHGIFHRHVFLSGAGGDFVVARLRQCVRGDARGGRVD